MKKENIRLIIMSVGYLLFSLVTLSVLVFAWFSIGSQSNALIDDIGASGAKTGYYFYKYDDNDANLGVELENQTLIDNVGTSKYVLFPSPTSENLLIKKTKPADRFAYALKVDVETQQKVKLQVYFSQVETFNNPINDPKIQIAFTYQITKLVYANFGPTTTLETPYGDPDIYTNNFAVENETYLMAKDLLFDGTENTKTSVIIFFELYYRPTGVIFNGNTLTNSNAFMNQSFVINKIWLDFDFV